MAAGKGHAPLLDALGISYRQLDHWCRLGLVPGQTQDVGQGGTRTFTPAARQHLGIMAVLVNQLGATPTLASAVATKLKKDNDVDLGYGVHLVGRT